jgi:hypothetical protein
MWGQNFAGNNPSIQVACNAYLDSVGYKYFQTAEASQYQQNAGTHVWQTAASGTAGNAITFTQAMTLDASGNLGVGVVPSAWSAIKPVQTGLAASFSGGSAFNDAFIASNAYYDGTDWRYINTNTAYLNSVGGSAAARWYTAPSGTAGNTISLTQAMTLDASGNLGIGATSPGTVIDAQDATSATRITVTNTANAAAGAGVNFLVKNGATTVGNATVRVDNADNLSFFNSVGETARITSAGDFLVGTTSAGTKSGDGVIGFGSDGGIIGNNNSSVAASGSLDIEVNTAGGGYQGFLAVANVLVGNAAVRTQSTFSVFGRGTDSSIQQIATDDGTSGGASFTVTTPSNGVIRITNTAASATQVTIQFFGGTSG